MRVLFVSPHFPEDIPRSATGAFQRMRMWLDAIESLGGEPEILFLRHRGREDDSTIGIRIVESWGYRCSVTVCSSEPLVQGGGLIADHVQTALSLMRHPLFRPYGGKLQRDAFAQCLTRSPDVVVFYYLQSTLAAGPGLLKSERSLLDLPDIEHRKFVREIGQPPKWRSKPLRYLQVPALWWGERAAIARSRNAFVCSDDDMRYLRRTMGVRNVHVIPNAVANVENGRLSNEPNVLFIGTFSYAPNVVAADYLIREVWPLLSAMCPGARLLIAGRRPELIPTFHNRPSGVEFLGFVSDLDTIYRRTRVCCCPIHSGGGTRIKILEAASYGVPVVSTPLGAEGIRFEPEQEIVIRADAVEIAQACRDLIVDYDRAQRIGMHARERVRYLYSRDRVVAQMRSILRDTCDGD